MHRRTIIRKPLLLMVAEIRLIQFVPLLRSLQRTKPFLSYASSPQTARNCSQGKPVVDHQILAVHIFREVRQQKQQRAANVVRIQHTFLATELSVGFEEAAGLIV